MYKTVRNSPTRLEPAEGARLCHSPSACAVLFGEEVGTTTDPVERTGADEDEQVFQQWQPELFGLAYRMLGSAVDAADVVAEAYLRWRSAPRHDVSNPKAYLATVVARLSIDALTSARARRETYVGPWLPEPLLTDEAGPAEASELSDSLSLAFLVLLEELTPAERAAFLLHDVFGYGYPEIAGALGRAEPACRQLVARARKDIGARRRRFEADQKLARQLADRFLAACAGGDLDALLAVMAEDVVVWTDGGGKAVAAPRPVVGAEKAARFLIGIARKTPPATEVLHVNLNGQPGFVAVEAGTAFSAVALDVADGVVCGVRVVANPDKLAALNSALAGRRGAAMQNSEEEAT
jgi:RNA polymerase sigma-70 factor, ECF subfamily